MPIIQAQKKSVRQSARRRVFNDRRRRAMRLVMKRINEFVSNKETAKAKELLPEAYKAIDKAEKQGIIKPNNASRKKALMSKITKETK